jgi:hypothetical protein
MSNSLYSEKKKRCPTLSSFLCCSFVAPVVPPWLNNVEWCCFSLLFLLSSNKNYGKAVLLPFLSGKKKCAGGIYSAGTISEKRTKNTFISKHMNTGQKEYGHLFIPKNRAKCSIEHKQKKILGNYFTLWLGNYSNMKYIIVRVFR